MEKSVLFLSALFCINGVFSAVTRMSLQRKLFLFLPTLITIAKGRTLFQNNYSECDILSDVTENSIVPHLAG